MPESLRQIKGRIKSVEGIEKLTAAMKMIATAKLKSLQRELASSTEYFTRLEGLLMRVLASFPDADNSFLRPAKASAAAVCVIASDTGLCGNYNNQLLHHAQNFISQRASADIRLIVVGGKAARFFRKKGLEPASSYEGLYGRYSEGIRNSLARDLAGLFLKGVVSEAYLAYTSFISTSRHQPVVEKILNIERPEPAAARYLTEPGAGRILEGLIPLYISAKIKQAMLNAFASEHAIRLFAMSEATDNAGELLDGLLLLRNKVRQAGITTEIIEVISSASAMKG